MNSDVQVMTMESHVIQQGESGLSVRKYCEVNEIKEHTFRYWKTKLDKRKTKGKFKIIEAVDSPQVVTNPIMSIIHPNKTELHIYSVLDAEYIRQLI